MAYVYFFILFVETECNIQPFCFLVIYLFFFQVLKIMTINDLLFRFDVEMILSIQLSE